MGCCCCRGWGWLVGAWRGSEGLEGQIASMGCALSVSLLHRASLKGGPHNYNKSKQTLGGSLNWAVNDQFLLSFIWK